MGDKEHGRSVHLFYRIVQLIQRLSDSSNKIEFV